MLKQVDLVCVEDTRISRRLFERYAIATPMHVLHDFTTTVDLQSLVARIRQHALAVALISDAGTPLLADPGYEFLRLNHEQQVPVYAVPGPCAAVALLSIAGIPCDRFVFEGFLASRSAARAKQLAALRTETRSMIFYEAPHRILASLDAMCENFGAERECAVARELTKLHETLYRGKLGAVVTAMRADPYAQQGELSVLVQGAEPIDATMAEREALNMLPLLAQHLGQRDAIKLAAEICKVKKNRLYSLAIGSEATQ